ncbi:MAG TPA: hypothetical protein VM870_10215 [Pyrinomonadaceae bacterium]|nr:hypothetical protein [Pyrinomonadaceae bacterium]
MKKQERKNNTQSTAPREIVVETSPKTDNSLAGLSSDIKASLGSEWMPEIYRARVIPLRTRAHRLGESAKKINSVEVQHTLLGVELKIGRRRVMCPDFPTARYLAAFARLGCVEIAVPYDITKVSRLADDLESSWHRMMLLIDHLTAQRQRAFRSRLSQNLVNEARQEITEIGAGAAIPQFNQNTKQRPSAPRSAA